MKISVAIATYNRAPMVRQAVLAALAQSESPYEVVVSDDASTDETVSAIQSLGDGRVKLIRQSKNSGGVGNWNAGVHGTSGDLIALCSDDDRFLPGHLERSTAYLEAHPEIGLVHSGFVDSIETADGEQQQSRPLRPPSVLTRRTLIPYLIRYYDWPFHPSTIVMRRKVWEQVGPFNPAYQFADSEWFLRVVEQFPVASLARHGVLNRRHPGNWSNRLGSAYLQHEIFEIVETAIARDFTGPRRAFWRAAWRANVRARLALTLRARLMSGHGEAACAVWHGLLQDTRLRTPSFIERAGAAAIRGLCAGRDPQFRDPRQSVSPL
jgi:glycosyltransferase involved in cell wall biosynthesis